MLRGTVAMPEPRTHRCGRSALCVDNTAGDRAQRHESATGARERLARSPPASYSWYSMRPGLCLSASLLCLAFSDRPAAQGGATLIDPQRRPASGVRVDLLTL